MPNEEGDAAGARKPFWEGQRVRVPRCGNAYGVLGKPYLAPAGSGSRILWQVWLPGVEAWMWVCERHVVPIKSPHSRACPTCGAVIGDEDEQEGKNI